MATLNQLYKSTRSIERFINGSLATNKCIEYLEKSYPFARSSPLDFAKSIANISSISAVASLGSASILSVDKILSSSAASILSADKILGPSAASILSADKILGPSAASILSVTFRQACMTI